MRINLVILLAGLSIAIAAVPVSGHHAFAAEFDANNPIKMSGTVTRMEWINPHTWIHIDVTQPDGSVEPWMIEGGPPNALYRRGFTRDSLPIGIEILVEGFRAKDTDASLTLADGTVSGLTLHTFDGTIPQLRRSLDRSLDAFFDLLPGAEEEDLDTFGD
jgi:hypothetical protein